MPDTKYSAGIAAALLSLLLAACGDEEPRTLTESQLSPRQREEIAALEALGYEDLEIRRAMRAVARSENPPESDDSDAWLRESLRWLSKATA